MSTIGIGGFVLGGGILLSSCAAPEAPARSSAPEPKTAVGAYCSRNADCPGGLQCDKSAPGGQCVSTCSTTADCGAGAVCTSDKVCNRACETTADCRGGFHCAGSGATRSCKVTNEPPEGLAGQPPDLHPLE